VLERRRLVRGHAHPQCFIVLSLSRFHAESNIKND
jgi:hypothetical protein